MLRMSYFNIAMERWMGSSHRMSGRTSKPVYNIVPFLVWSKKFVLQRCVGGREGGERETPKFNI